MKQYYIFLNEEQLGPFNLDDLKATKISRDTKVWFEGLNDWKNAGEIEELKMIFSTVPPPINAFASIPPNPPAESMKNASIQVKDIDDTPKIFGLKKNVFIGVVSVLVVLIGIMSFNSVQESKRIELMQQNQQTETHNQQLQLQQKEIEEQNIRLAEQEKIEAQRIAKEKKQAIENRLLEIENLLAINYQNLETAQAKLNNATSFKLLRSSSERNEEISLAQYDVDFYKEEIKNLQVEIKKLNR